MGFAAELEDASLEVDRYPKVCQLVQEIAVTRVSTVDNRPKHVSKIAAAGNAVWRLSANAESPILVLRTDVL
jgi:hypothetical protein